MIVPEYWAEARLQKRTHDQQFTVRRFGWSDDSEAAAQRLADERAAAALERLVSGEKILRREPKVPYNGAEGVPIREQIVARHGDTVITRNSYGATCLNTPDVLFADVDFGSTVSLWWVAGVGVTALLLALLLVPSTRHGAPAAGLLVLVLLLAYPLAALLHATAIRLRGGPQAVARRRIHRFCTAHPDWHLRVYRTPAGFRVLVMHDVFAPRSEDVTHAFRALRVDPIYARMCQVQNCFRARLSAKPWRIGIDHHLKPRPGVWPVAAEHLGRRQRWIAAYDDAARNFAACRFVEQLGSSRSHANAVAVRRLHDALCRSDSDRPIA